MSSKPRRMTYLLIAIPTILLAGIAVVVVLSHRPVELGLVEGKLRPCPEKPNCVCSTATDEEHAIAALTLRGDDALGAFAELVALTEGMDGARVVEVGATYAHFAFTTPILHFQDDLELHLDPATGQAQVRSSSRVGHSDLGANRKRVEALRTDWDALQSSVPGTPGDSDQ
ncbi:MAG: hypothetical protein ACI82F_003745 [Planctomycetota bacterium]|jgi:uncharacterized protein (DUF1499 family)